MIDIGDFNRCVCMARGIPHSLCEGVLSFEEKGKRVTLKPRKGEVAVALVLDGCVCMDGGRRCDGLFLLSGRNKRWIISVELKGVDFQSAFEQLAETRIHRLEYQNIKTMFREQGAGQLIEISFVVSNGMLGSHEKTNLEDQFGIRVKSILFSEATQPVPDLRREL